MLVEGKTILYDGLTTLQRFFSSSGTAYTHIRSATPCSGVCYGVGMGRNDKKGRVGYPIPSLTTLRTPEAKRRTRRGARTIIRVTLKQGLIAF